jgi:hypothetical protein
MTKPTKVTIQPWLIEESLEIVDKFDNFNCVGKWLLFFNKEELDSAWERVKELYNKGDFFGVYSVRVSTSFPNPKRDISEEDMGVIMFLCTSSYREEYINEIGENIVELLNYSPPEGKHVYYKTDEQTKVGSRSTGQNKNYLYKLEMKN